MTSLRLDARCERLNPDSFCNLFGSASRHWVVARRRLLVSIIRCPPARGGQAMIRVIDLVGYAAPMMVLLLTREMSLRALGMLSRVAVVIVGIVMCLLPVLLPHLILLPMSILRLWDMLTGTSGESAKRQAKWLRQKGG